MACETVDGTGGGTGRLVGARVCWLLVELALWQPPKASSRSKIAASCIHCQFRFLFMCLTVEELRKRRAGQTVSKFVAESNPSFAVHLHPLANCLAARPQKTVADHTLLTWMVPESRRW